MNNLKKMRKKAGLTQETMAERLGVSVVSVSRWERGIAKPGKLVMMVINRAADELGLTRPFDGPPLPKGLGVRWPEIGGKRQG